MPDPLHLATLLTPALATSHTIASVHFGPIGLSARFNTVMAVLDLARRARAAAASPPSPATPLAPEAESLELLEWGAVMECVGKFCATYLGRQALLKMEITTSQGESEVRRPLPPSGLCSSAAARAPS